MRAAVDHAPALVNPRARALQAWLARPHSFSRSFSLLGFSPGDTGVLWGAGPAARLDAGGFAGFCRLLTIVQMLTSQIANTKIAATAVDSLAVVTAGGVLTAVFATAAVRACTPSAPHPLPALEPLFPYRRSSGVFRTVTVLRATTTALAPVLEVRVVLLRRIFPPRRAGVGARTL